MKIINSHIFKSSIKKSPSIYTKSQKQPFMYKQPPILELRALNNKRLRSWLVCRID